MKVVVIGGTGLVGSKLVEQLDRAGHAAIAAARSTGVDAITGAGLDAVLDGADAMVDASNPGYADPAEMLRFFERSSRMLLAAEDRAKVPHHIVFSAIGTGRVTGGYYRAKDVQEALVARSGIPFTIVRSAPLFEYIYDAFDADRAAEVVRVPPVRVQPIAADDAAGELLRVVERPPANAVVEVAGPNIYQLPSLAQQILTAKDDYRPVVTDRDATFFGARMIDEALIGGAADQLNSTSFKDWLRRSLAPA